MRAPTVVQGWIRAIYVWDAEVIYSLAALHWKSRVTLEFMVKCRSLVIPIDCWDDLRFFSQGLLVPREMHGHVAFIEALQSHCVPNIGWLETTLLLYGWGLSPSSCMSYNKRKYDILHKYINCYIYIKIQDWNASVSFNQNKLYHIYIYIEHAIIIKANKTYPSLQEEKMCTVVQTSW